jgi:hypothetical protein
MEKITQKKRIEFIRTKISTDTRWAQRALETIYKNQTEDEKRAEDVKHNNLIGFTTADGRILSGMASFLKRNGYLTERQMNVVFKRIPKYAGQLFRQSDQEKLLNQITAK